MKESATPKRGRPAGSTTDKTPTTPQLLLVARWKLFPADARPSARAMAQALGVNPATFHRNLLAPHRFTPAQLDAAGQLLDAASPAGWGRPHPADYLDE